jgi:hypothetical protein
MGSPAGHITTARTGITHARAGGSMMDNDEIVLEDAKEVAFALDKTLRRAIMNADFDRVMTLKPQVDHAFKQYSQARLQLLQEGMLATEEDIGAMHRIRAEIDQAATTQALVQGAIRFVALLAKFV